MDRILLLMFHTALVTRIRSAGEVFKMRNKNNLMNLILALGAVFIFSVALRAQTAQQSGAATARSITPTVDLAGVWEANMPGLKWATYSFTPDIPPMTPWGKQRYLAVKPSYGTRSFADSTDT